eukprot:jgi/Chlat1/4488/Chrsp29S04425
MVTAAAAAVVVVVTAGSSVVPSLSLRRNGAVAAPQPRVHVASSWRQSQLPAANSRLLRRRAPAGALRAACQVTTSEEEESKVIGRAEIPKDVIPEVFNQKMWQWASTLTSSGKNLPLSLALKVDRLDDGVQLTLLGTSKKGDILPVVDIIARLDENNLYVVKQRQGPLRDVMVDVPLLMNSMKEAIIFSVRDSQRRQ